MLYDFASWFLDILMPLFKVSSIINWWQIDLLDTFFSSWTIICFKYISMWSVYWTVKLCSGGINRYPLSSGYTRHKINAISIINTRIIFGEPIRRSRRYLSALHSWKDVYRMFVSWPVSLFGLDCGPWFFSWDWLCGCYSRGPSVIPIRGR